MSYDDKAWLWPYRKGGECTHLFEKKWNSIPKLQFCPLSCSSKGAAISIKLTKILPFDCLDIYSWKCSWRGKALLFANAFYFFAMHKCYFNSYFRVMVMQYIKLWKDRTVSVGTATRELSNKGNGNLDASRSHIPQKV